MDKFFDKKGADESKRKIESAEKNVNESLRVIRLSILGDEALTSATDLKKFGSDEAIDLYFNKSCKEYISKVKIPIVGERVRIEDEFMQASTETKRLLKPLRDIMNEYPSLDYVIEGGVFRFNPDTIETVIKDKHTIVFTPEECEAFNRYMEIVRLAREAEKFENEKGLTRFIRVGRLFRGIYDKDGYGTMRNILQLDYDTTANEYDLDDYSKIEEWLTSEFICGHLGKLKKN